MNGPKVCGRGISQRHTMCGNIRYKHYESKEKDTTDNSNEETTEGSDVTDTTTDEIPTTNVDEEPISTTEGSDVTDTTTDKILTTNINEEPISTTSNPHQNFNGMFMYSIQCRGATPWARVANFVKKPPLIVNVTYLKLNGFNASMWVS